MSCAIWAVFIAGFAADFHSTWRGAGTAEVPVGAFLVLMTSNGDHDEEEA